MGTKINAYFPTVEDLLTDFLRRVAPKETQIAVPDNIHFQLESVENIRSSRSKIVKNGRIYVQRAKFLVLQEGPENPLALIELEGKVQNESEKVESGRWSVWRLHYSPTRDAPGRSGWETFLAARKAYIIGTDFS